MVLLLTDPLEMAPPDGLLAFAPADGDAAPRIELDLGAPGQRQRWHQAFAGRTEGTIAALAARGVVARALSCDAPSDAWLATGDSGRH